MARRNPSTTRDTPTTDTPASRLLFRAFNAALAVGETVSSRPGLDADELERGARRVTGLRDFGDPYYHEGLERLVASAERETKLNPYGRFLLRRVATLSLEGGAVLLAARCRVTSPHTKPSPPNTSAWAAAWATSSGSAT